MKKKVDRRIKILIENGIKTRQRSIFLIVGDRGKDQVPLFLFNSPISFPGCQYP
jgi:N-acetyltransferase 10